MINNKKTTMALIEEMKAILPILAYPTSRLRHNLQAENNIKLKPKNILTIKDVLYLGEEGGIGCAISIKNDTEVLITSLTHLHIKKPHPLLKQIKAYQINRITMLARHK